MSEFEDLVLEYEGGFPGSGPNWAAYEKMKARGRYLEEENARLREAARWIPVSERLPESPDYCLVIYDNRDYNRAIAFYKNGDWYKYSDWMISNVTHWMLLPKPPEVE